LSCSSSRGNVKEERVSVTVDGYTGRTGEARDGVQFAQEVEQCRRRPCSAVVGQVVAEVVHRGAGRRNTRNSRQPPEGVDTGQGGPG